MASRTEIRTLLGVAALLAAFAAVADTVERRVLNNGNLVLEDVPEIPQDLRRELYRWQEVRSAALRAFTADGKGIYVSTGFGSVNALHRIEMPMGARKQQTFYLEPVGQVKRRPGSEQLAFTRDAGGSEFAQVFLVEL